MFDSATSPIRTVDDIRAVNAGAISSTGYFDPGYLESHGETIVGSPVVIDADSGHVVIRKPGGHYAVTFYQRTHYANGHGLHNYAETSRVFRHVLINLSTERDKKMSYTPAMPTNNDDVIDSRDVIHWIDSLTQEFIDATGSDPADVMSVDDWKHGLTDDDAEALTALIALKEEAEHAADWEYGETLIRDPYFPDYAEQLAEETGAIDREASWPLRHIDWEAAAEDLQQDYYTVQFDGVQYWIRF